MYMHWRYLTTVNIMTWNKTGLVPVDATQFKIGLFINPGHDVIQQNWSWLMDAMQNYDLSRSIYPRGSDMPTVQS